MATLLYLKRSAMDFLLGVQFDFTTNLKKYVAFISVIELPRIPACHPKDSIVITVISDNKAKNSLNANFIKDSGFAITFKANNGQFHDRFIILDFKTPNEQFYHCGASSKDAGNKITAINKLGDGYGYRSAIDVALRETSYTID